MAQHKNKFKKFFPKEIRMLIPFALALFMATAALAAYREARITRLNFFMPRSYEVLMDIFENKDAVRNPKAHLRRYAFYYQLLVEEMPQRADAWGMHGFFSYQLGKTQKAAAAYRQAIQLNPSFFWFHYNLGIIYLKQGRYKDALTILNTGRALAPQNSLSFIISSRIYMPMIADRYKNFQASLTRQIRKGYRDAQGLMALSAYYLQNPDKPAEEAQAIDLEIF